MTTAGHPLRKHREYESATYRSGHITFRLQLENHAFVAAKIDAAVEGLALAVSETRQHKPPLEWTLRETHAYGLSAQIEGNQDSVTTV